METTGKFLNEKEVAKELMKLYDIEATEDYPEEEIISNIETYLNLVTEYGVTFYRAVVEDEEIMIFEDSSDAEEYAKAIVARDLEDEPSLFNKDWLKGLMNDTIEGESFIEHAAQDAVDIDGVAHFLATYDGDERETESGFMVYRTN